MYVGDDTCTLRWGMPGREARAPRGDFRRLFYLPKLTY
jgi:hypothetical protein